MDPTAPMLARVLAAVAAGTALLGCAARSVDDGAQGSSGGDAGDGDGGDTRGGGDDGGASAGTAPTPVTTAADSADDGSEAEVDDGHAEGSTGTSGSESGSIGDKLDIGVVRPEPDPLCDEVPPDGPFCDVMPGPDEAIAFACLDGVGSDQCGDISFRTVMNAAQECLGCGGFAQDIVCDPVFTGDACCYWVLYEPGQSCPGRPLSVDGACRLPALASRDDWRADAPIDVADLDAATRAALADAWAQDARFEHASVASFSRFVLQLLAIGAPPSLVADAQRALGEEIEHARALFAIASRLAARAIGPGPLDVSGALDDALDPIAIAESLAREGCIAETISALQLAIAASGAADPELRAVLRRIADEELAHAELAWRALAWIVARGGAAVRTAVAAVFAEPAGAVPRGADPPAGIERARLAAHGRLAPGEALAIAERALASIVAPAAAALTAPFTVAASAPAWT